MNRLSLQNTIPEQNNKQSVSVNASTAQLVNQDTTAKNGTYKKSTGCKPC